MPASRRAIDYLLVDQLDVGADALAVLAERMLRHAAFILGREVVGERLLHLVEARARLGGGFHPGDEIAEVAAEERELIPRHDVAVAGNDPVELEALER